MPFEEKPLKLVPITYVPQGIRHPVKTKESWVSIAQEHGLDPWDLIDHNFPGLKQVKERNFQLATRHVNWYLREYIGCRTSTPDSRNWTFTSGLTGGKGAWKGGVIYIPARKAVVPPPPPPPPPKRTIVLPTQPLPRDQEDRYQQALEALELKVNASLDLRSKRYRCWFTKLKAGGDDRVVRWYRIYPTIHPPMIVGPRDITHGTPVGQDVIEAKVKSVADVDEAGRSLGFIVHMRSQILSTWESTSESQHLKNFHRLNDDMSLAIEKLDIWSNNGLGGSSAMPPAYRAIKDWMAMRQRDSKSVYSCF
jgi:hypothetical protein